MMKMRSLPLNPQRPTYGINDVFIGQPAVVGAHGIVRPEHPIE